MENWNMFLKKLEEKGWKLVYEDNHLLTFEHKTFGEVTFAATITQEEILKALEEMEDKK